MPVRYSSDLAEHHAVRTAAGLFDLSHMGEIVVIGPEAGQPLDYALAGKLSAHRHRPGQVQPPARRAPAASSTTSSSTAPATTATWSSRTRRTATLVAEELRDRTAPFDAEVFDESDDIALIAVQGPAALVDPRCATAGFAVEGGALDGDDFAERLADAQVLLVASRRPSSQHPVLIARTGYTGEDGFELYVAPDNARAALGCAARGRRRAGPRARRARQPRHAAPRGRACRCTATSSASTPSRRRPASAASSTSPRTPTSSAAPRARTARMPTPACSSG